MVMNYFYGTQADRFSFIPIPKTLMTEKVFSELQSWSKITYGFLMDRMQFSLKHYGLNDSTTITDTVAYKNLKPGKEYTMTGTLMDKTSGGAITDADGKEITSSLKFTPEKKDGEVTLAFAIPAGPLAGKSVVSFERAVVTKDNAEVTVASHEDLKDAAQTVAVPKIATNAKDHGTKTHKGKAGKTVTIDDTVTYSNLVPGKEYTMTGTLMDKSTGKALAGADGKTITVSKKFTAEKADGSVVITLRYPAIS